MNYHYDNENNDTPEYENESVYEPPVHDTDASAQDVDKPETAESYEHSADDWCEPNFCGVSKHEEPVFTPGLGSRHFYMPPHNDSPKRETAEHEAPGRRRRGGFARAICLVLVCAVISTAVSVGGVYYGINSGLIAVPATQVVLGATPPPEASPVADVADPNETPPVVVTPANGALTGKDIYIMASQQVVGVSTEISGSGNFNPFYGGGASSVYGTGFIISEDGYILTNYHVIETAYTNGVSPQIILRDGTSYSARIIGFEASNDVAVLKIDATGLSPVKIGSSAAVQPGEEIYAVGNPNQLDYTITDGIVSALDREVQVDSGTGYSITMFQISAAVNSGNSGGPVYNIFGEVIGVVSAKYMSTGTEGLGFAIPIDDAMDIATDLITVGYVTGKAQLGVNVLTMSAANAEYYGTVAGAFVFTVNRGSCAEAAGIKPGDIITKLGDTEVTSPDTLKEALGDYKAGDTVAIEVYRDGGSLTLSVTFDEQNGMAAGGSQNIDIPSAG